MKKINLIRMVLLGGLLAASSTAFGMGKHELDAAKGPASSRWRSHEGALSWPSKTMRARHSADTTRWPSQDTESAPKPEAASSQKVSSFGQKVRDHFNFDTLFPPDKKNLPRMGLQVLYGVADAAAIIKLRSMNWQARSRIRAIETARLQDHDDLLRIIQNYKRLESELKNVDQLLKEKDAEIRTLGNEDVELQKRVDSIEDDLRKLTRKRIQSQKVKEQIGNLMAERSTLKSRINYIKTHPNELLGSNRMQATMLRDRHADLLTKKRAIITDLESLKPQYKTALIPMQTLRGPAVRIAANKTLGYILKAGMVLCVLDVGGRLFIWNALDRNPGFLPLVKVSYAGYKTAREAVQALDDKTFNLLK